MEKVFKIDVAGRSVEVEVGKLAKFANGSCLVRYGDTAVLSCATMSAMPREDIDFFPLGVDYEERFYAAGKIPGSYSKREGRPSEKAILTSRVIDRPLRPFFPKDFRNDVSVNATVLAVDGDNSPEFAAMLGCSIALAVSDIPFEDTVASVCLGMIRGEYVINPTSAQRAESEMLITVAGTMERIVMIEAAAREVPDDVVYRGILFAHEQIKKLCTFISNIVSEVGVPKYLDYPSFTLDSQMYDDVKAFGLEMLESALNVPEKSQREKGLLALSEQICYHFSEKYPDCQKQIKECIKKVEKEIVRSWILNSNKRVDGRHSDEIRPLHCEIGMFKRVHGSALFSRGYTQVLTVATLGALGDSQRLDGLDDTEEKRYMHHYNFPAFSVGDTKPSRGPGRREIGHGALAERALEPVIPSTEQFPYSIRLVSEVLSSNGSTSQASVCASTLALMDAGVPITTPVAGISVGLVTEGDREVTILDIQGVEDFYGDMDFKVAGTAKGITAIQVDIKTHGLSHQIVLEALQKTRKARLEILEFMAATIDKPREKLSEFAPHVFTMQIEVDKIRDVIGSGGKIIQKIISDTGVKIDISDSGFVNILSTDEASGKEALSIISNIVREPAVGEVYMARVVKITSFGAFVEFLPGKEGLVHISNFSDKRIDKVEDVVSVGDEIAAKITEIDSLGRVNLTCKNVKI